MLRGGGKNGAIIAQVTRTQCNQFSKLCYQNLLSCRGAKLYEEQNIALLVVPLVNFVDLMMFGCFGLANLCEDAVQS